MKNPALKGKWEWGELLTYGDVIHYWRIWPPSKFFLSDKDDKAFAVAYYESKKGMEAWEAHVQNVKNQSDTAGIGSSDE